MQRSRTSELTPLAEVSIGTLQELRVPSEASQNFGAPLGGGEETKSALRSPAFRKEGVLRGIASVTKLFISAVLTTCHLTSASA